MIKPLLFTLAVSFFALPCCVFAATPVDFGKQKTDAPIEVSADSFLADIKGKTGTYVGNVIVKQGDMRLRADKVRVNVVNDRPDTIEADGHVIFDAPSGTAQGDKGIYAIAPRTITLSGKVVLAKDKNVMRGTSLVVNLATGAATLGARGTQGGRVQGLFTPPPQPKSAPRPAPATIP